MPAFNEERSIAAVLISVKKALPTAHVLVVDDCSTDRTAAVACRQDVDVLRLPFNLGVGGAIRAGFAYAQERRFRAVVQIDADGQHDPAYIADLLASLRTADIVVGARFAGASDYGVKGPRRWLIWAFSRIVSRSGNCRLTDVTSGFRATGPRGIRLFASTYPADYLGDTVESLMIALQAGLVVDQVPVKMFARASGVPSQGRFRSIAHVARTVLAMSMALTRHWQSASPGFERA